LEEQIVKMENGSDLKWFLGVSVALLIFTTYLYYGYIYGYYYYYHPKDIWFYLRVINIPIWILSLCFSSLAIVEFWDKQLMRKASIFFFVVAMGMLFIVNLQLLFT